MRRFVYFIQQAEDVNGPIKIGTATNLTSRLKSLQCGNPEELRILAFVASNEALESLLHGYFRDGHIRGEWFHAYTPGLREFIRGVRRRELPTWALPYLATEEACA